MPIVQYSEILLKYAYWLKQAYLASTVGTHVAERVKSFLMYGKCERFRANEEGYVTEKLVYNGCCCSMLVEGRGWRHWRQLLCVIWLAAIDASARLSPLYQFTSCSLIMSAKLVAANVHHARHRWRTFRNHASDFASPSSKLVYGAEYKFVTSNTVPASSEFIGLLIPGHWDMLHLLRCVFQFSQT